MNRVLNTTNKWVFIFTFLLVSLIIFTITSIDKKSRIDSYLKNTTDTFISQYNTVYNSYMNISKASHSIIFDSPIITTLLMDSLNENPIYVSVARINLYNHLKNKYEKLNKIGLKQLHFHTKDNISFLRMHQAEKYGDDLSDIRYSVKYVNENQKFIHGLEVGRISHGFRFVYPMYNKDYYLGSVEFSISSRAFVQSIENAFDTDIHFIVDKDIIVSKILEQYKSNYVTSIESKRYLNLRENEDIKHSSSHINKNILQEELADKIEKNLKKKIAFSLYLKDHDSYKVATFLPLKNIKEQKVIAYMVSYRKNENIKDIHKDFIEINIILISLSLLILYFIYLLNTNRQKLLNEQKMISENTKLDSMRDMIGNIAHHWRQPLSVISTSASGLMVQSELGILKNDYLEKSLNSIINTTKKLSDTIDEFRDFMIHENKHSSFYIKDMLDKLFIITQSPIQKNQIEFIKDINCNTKITSIQNILVDALVKIIINSVDALNKIAEDKIIILSLEKRGKTIIITIQDSAGGIDESIIDNIYEPYFTTKHQTVGTGLGLYTVKSNITNILKGEILAQNSTFNHNSKNYSGAMFKITLPIKN